MPEPEPEATGDEVDSVDCDSVWASVEGLSDGAESWTGLAAALYDSTMICIYTASKGRVTKRVITVEQSGHDKILNSGGGACGDTVA